MALNSLSVLKLLLNTNQPTTEENSDENKLWTGIVLYYCQYRALSDEGL